MDAIYVGCHLCHAQVGEACRFGLAKGEKYHSRRVNQAERGPHWIDTEHARAHGALCTGHSSDDPGWQDLCTKCGQGIARLRGIPALLADQES
ncbi:MAG TPA: hypothetical protein VLA31_04270 [Burkholderiaceae bacterium]|nr:hypothetical protein [Burkholderiaceae bacterium]